MAELMLVNPRPRKRKSKKRKPRKTKSRATKRKTTRRKPVARKRKSRRRNPSARTVVKGDIMPAFMYATGALAIDVLWNFIPVPANMKMGPLRHIVKGLGAIGLGMLAGNFINKKTARSMTQGALTVVAYQALKEVAQPMLPNIPLGYYSPGRPMGEYTNGLGAYVPGGSNASPYLAADTLATPFAGPSAADACATRERNLGCY